jgi:uncharacterized membrane protein (DUF4010 family)
MSGLTLQSILLSLVVGGIIGLEREYQHDEKLISKKHADAVLGVRSFALISLLGALSGAFLSTNPFLTIIITLGLITIIISSYFIGSKSTGDIGITTEIAAVIAFVLGTIITSGISSINLVIACAILVSLFLSRKKQIKSFARMLYHYEMDSFIAYAVIALVILPFIPNVVYTLRDIQIIPVVVSAYNIQISQFLDIELINPYRLWFIVALISGLDVIGYILNKFSNSQRKNIVLSSITGGFISSTSTTVALATRSKSELNTISLVGGAILANAASFLQHFALIAPLNSLFLVSVTPFVLSLSLSAFVIGIIMVSKKGTTSSSKYKKTKVITSVFALRPALKFAVLFIIIRFFSKFMIVIFGSNGLFLSSIVASFSGVDAITITISELVGTKITAITGIYALVIANGVNLVVKTVYSFMSGTPKFAMLFGISMTVIFLIGILPVIFIH